WRLQSRHPALDVRNYGTAAYGTYQSLLVLERLLESPQRPSMVLYSFIEDHEQRNVAPAAWLAGLSRYASRGHTEGPYGTPDATGSLHRHEPEHYLMLPLREHSATVAALEALYMQQKTRARAAMKRAVTEKLITTLRDRCRAADIEFAVALITPVKET